MGVLIACAHFLACWLHLLDPTSELILVVPCFSQIGYLCRSHLLIGSPIFLFPGAYCYLLLLVVWFPSNPQCSLIGPLLSLLWFLIGPHPSLSLLVDWFISSILLVDCDRLSCTSLIGSTIYPVSTISPLAASRNAVSPTQTICPPLLYIF